MGKPKKTQKANAVEVGSSGPLMGSEIFRIVAFVEKRLTSFAISRLVMMSGVSVRKYKSDSADDPQDLRKVRGVLSSLLSSEEVSELDMLLRH